MCKQKEGEHPKTSMSLKSILSLIKCPFRISHYRNFRSKYTKPLLHVHFFGRKIKLMLQGIKTKAEEETDIQQKQERLW